ncbi:MAG: hypothetical protein JNL76_06500 [Alphaproteobacteria bacterium]|nr:hypothetical protein [Alphaproteobacteria bacterium]
MVKYSMVKYIFVVFCLCLSLAGCAPYINAANKNMVTIYVPNTSYESDALSIADAHCAQYGLTAKLRKPRSSGTIGDLYDYNCVP